MSQIGRSTNINTTKNVGSKASFSASVKAANVAIGSNGANVTNKTPQYSQRPLGSVKQSIHPGSRAGLNDQKSVHLRANHSGYAAKENQIARFRQKPSMASVRSAPNISSSTCQPKLFDSRLCKSDNCSIAKLAKRI